MFQAMDSHQQRMVKKFRILKYNLISVGYPSQVDYIDKILQTTVETFQKLNIDRVEFNTPVSRELMRLLKIFIDQYNNVLTVIQLTYFAPLMELFDFYGRKSVSAYLISNALNNETLVPTSESVDSILTIVSSLVQDQEDHPAEVCCSNLIGFHLIKKSSSQQNFKILN